MVTDLRLESPPVATLLTGVGYIGAALLRRLYERDGTSAPVVALENFYCTPRRDVRAVLPPGTLLVEGDVTRPRDVSHAFDLLGSARDQPLVVYHLAAQPSASIAALEPELTEQTNLVGARLVLQAARERGAGVVFGGSFRVYGDDLDGQAVTEQTPYGRVGDLSHLSKVYVEQYGRMVGLPFVSVRLGVTYGLSPIMKTSPAFMTVPNLFCQRAMNGEPLRVLEDRPLAFIHVQDAAQALIRGAERLAAAPNAWEVVNAAPEVATIGHLARTVQRLVQSRGGTVEIQGASTARANPTPAAFSVHSRLVDDGFRPMHRLSDGLGDVLDLFESLR
jgi:nucleoside-diphosphate-sugar epimerase